MAYLTESLLIISVVYYSFSFTFSAFSCALSREILLQGRMYVSQGWFCFYSNIFGWENQVNDAFLSSSNQLSCSCVCNIGIDRQEIFGRQAGPLVLKGC